MSILNHPSLPKPPKKRLFSKPGPELILKNLVRDKKVPDGFKKKWKKGNEERMLGALERFGHLQLRVKFELLEEDDNGFLRYKTLAGRTLVFKKIATQGCLLAIAERLADAGVEEARNWTEKRNGLRTT